MLTVKPKALSLRHISLFMKRFTLLIFFIVSICGAFAQNISVKSFKALPMDLTASSLEGKRIDQNGYVAALIKIVTSEMGFTFEAGTLGIVDSKQETGEVWVWVPEKSKKITIKHQQLGVLRDYRYPIEIERERTYEMVLTTAKIETIIIDEVHEQYLVFQLNPPDAMLEVNDQMWPVSATGTAKKLVNFGTYTYRVQAMNYHADAGMVTVDDPDNPEKVVVTLYPNFGWVEVPGDGALQGAAVYVDNSLIGKAPCRSDALKSGQHNVRIVKEMFEPMSITVTVSDNETTTISPNLTADFAHVTLKVDADAEIWVNDERKGTRTWTGDLGSGTYKMECKMDNHETTMVKMEITNQMDGDVITLEVPKPICGSLVVESEPDEADIFVDGKRIGVTPRLINELLIGQHEVKLTKEGYSDYNETVMIRKGERSKLDVVMNNDPIVEFVCNVNDAVMKIDGVNVGNASGRFKLNVGRHNIKVSANGYEDFATIIFVDDDTKYFSIDMQKVGRSVRFVCSAPYSQLKIDGQNMGSASGTYKLQDGRHSIFVTADGYHDFSGYVEVDANASYFTIDMRSETKDEETFTVNGVSFTMKLVEGGTFQMGATSEQGSDAESGEKPVHSVTLSNYYMGETEVTQALWKAVMGNNPSYFKGDNLPVEQVSWNDCQEFIRKLNQKTGKNFRLPTEAEWEYAARGGKKSRGYKYAGSNNIGSVAWYTDNSGYKTYAVKGKSPNELGLYDMSGNVWEWCSDWCGSDYYGKSPSTNPQGPLNGSYRVLRGGSWIDGAGGCRVSDRSDGGPDRAYCSGGFRLALPQ